MSAKSQYNNKAAEPLSMPNPFREKRLHMGVTQEALAQKSDVPVEVVVAAEERPTSLPLFEISKLANFLNLDPGQVFEYLHAKLARLSREEES